jgi:hypothetical protein
MAIGIGIGLAFAGSVKPWSPSDESPEMWLRASAADVVLAGADVTTWTDRTANGHDATEAVTMPSYVASHAALGSKPAVRFDATEGMNNIDGAHPAPDDWTYFAVIDVPAHAASMMPIIWDGPGGISPAYQLNAVGNFSGYTHWPDGNQSIVDAIDGPQVLVWTLEQATSTGNLYRNGILQGSGTYSVQDSCIDAGAYLVYASSTMYVAEVGIFHGAFNAAKLAKLHAYVHGRYGV